MTDVTDARIKTGFVDVHAHFVPPIDTAQRALMERAYQAANFLALPASSWSPDDALAFMDERGIAAQLLSSPNNMTVERAKKANDYAAGLVAKWPSRFGMLANLPLSDPGAAAAEAGRAADELGADGFVLVTNYDGAYLGDMRFDPVFAELDRRGATVFLHPVMPAGFDATSCGRPGPVIEFPFDTARTVTDAIYARVFQRYPNFSMILAHAGGVLPVLAQRLATIGTLPWVPNPNGVTGADVLAQLAGLYYDTAIAGTPTSLLPLLQSTTPDHVVFGTDYPPASVPVIDANLAALREGTALAADEVAAMRPNTLRLFPTLAGRLKRVAGRDIID